MKILLAGNLGYVGSVLVRHLRRVFPDAKLIGYDNGYFAHCLTNAHETPERHMNLQFWGDIRRIDPGILEGVGRQTITADWALDLGYTRYMRHQDLVGKGQSDSLFITLHRAFSVRY